MGIRNDSLRGWEYGEYVERDVVLPIGDRTTTGCTIIIILLFLGDSVMNRRNLIKSLTGAGIGSLVAVGKLFGSDSKGNLQRSTCFLTPQETQGPYYFDPNLLRQDVRQDTGTSAIKTGVPLALTFTVINSSCTPVPNVLVDIWHCDKDGLYSGYAGQPGGISTIGQNFLRGTQLTDANGMCSFTTIYPGWYPGRVTHIHFKVRLSSTTYVTSQFAFPDNINTLVYNTSLYLGRGQNSLTNATDSVFQNSSPEHEIITITTNSSTGGYDGAFTIGINAPTGVNDPIDQPDGYLLKQNYPNPFNPTTTISYHLANASDVKLIIYDVFGREILTLVDAKQPAGTYEVLFDGSTLSSGFYYYKLIAGNVIEAKEMLLVK